VKAYFTKQNHCGPVVLQVLWAIFSVALHIIPFKGKSFLFFTWHFSSSERKVLKAINGFSLIESFVFHLTSLITGMGDLHPCTTGLPASLSPGLMV
jgi:hypothetical protein